MKIIKYDIVQAESHEVLVKFIEVRINAGYQPYGSPFSALVKGAHDSAFQDTFRFYQAIVIYGE
jgi:uncharacterized protein DUF1737